MASALENTKRILKIKNNAVIEEKLKDLVICFDGEEFLLTYDDDKDFGWYIYIVCDINKNVIYQDADSFIIIGVTETNAMENMKGEFIRKRGL